MTTSRIGRGAIVTLGAAASMAWAAGAANACDTTPQPPKPTNPHTHGHSPNSHTPPKTAPNTVCTVDDHDVQYGELAKDGSVVGGWHDAVTETFKGNNPEPAYGYQVRLNPKTVAADCTGTVDVSLASYNTGGPTWDSSGGPQQFVDYDHVQLSTQSKTSTTQTLTVKLPGTPGSAKCFGQIDLYFGSQIYDGTPGHGRLPSHDDNVNTPGKLITAWNGNDIGGCAATPPVKTPPPPAPPKTTPPTTPPTTSPSTPATPPATTTTPGTPTLAHTGSNAGELSLVALAFFGAGGTAMFASRKAKAAGKH